MQMQLPDGTNTARASVNSMLRLIFVGEYGIRAGWSALLFVTIYLILDRIATAGLNHFVMLEPRGPLPPTLVFLQETSGVLVLFLATGTMARIEHRPLLSFGFVDDFGGIRLVGGVAWGLLSLSALIGVLWKTHLLAFDGLALTGLAAWNYALVWASVALVVGTFEESLLRGYLQH